MEMRTADVYSNLKNYSCWDYKNYRLTKDEADKCVEALRCAVWHPVELEGLPKQEGSYLCTVKWSCPIALLIVELKDNLYSTLGGYIDRSIITAWAYLPKPYEGK